MLRRDVGTITVVIETDHDSADEHGKTVHYVTQNILDANYRNPKVKFLASVAEFNDGEYQVKAFGTPSPEVASILDEITEQESA